MARFEMSGAEIASLVPAGADGRAFFELACMYAAGRSVAPDLVAAHTWFNVSAARGCREAAERRAEVAAEMSAAEVAAAQREARLWLTRH